MKTARAAVLESLCRCDEEGAFSNIVIDKALTGLMARDRAFAGRLFYGVLERKITLDFCIAKYSKFPLEKISADILNILRMGIYQLVFMKSVPDNAAVNESVELAAGKTSAKGFVNAVLRSFLRDDKKILLPSEKTQPLKNLSVKYSCPEGLISKFQNEYGRESTLEILKASLKVPPMFIRVNTVKTNLKTLAAKLSERGVKVFKSGDCENCLALSNSGSIENMPEYKAGLFYVQDLASQLLCGLIAPESGETVLDMCAAPGGKTFTLAQYMEDRGAVYAFDIHPHRVNLIASGAKRLGLQCVETSANNAAVLNPSLPIADKVLCDVPCSGFGVIRRKPEIKYKDPETFEELSAVQMNILSVSSKYVKPGGSLIYSTCTLSRRENDDIAESFLKENPGFSPLEIQGYNDYKHTFLPGEYNSDGFFAAMFKKTGK